MMGKESKQVGMAHPAFSAPPRAHARELPRGYLPAKASRQPCVLGVHVAGTTPLMSSAPGEQAPRGICSV